jgi:hypothetical protein
VNEDAFWSEIEKIAEEQPFAGLKRLPIPPEAQAAFNRKLELAGLGGTTNPYRSTRTGVSRADLQGLCLLHAPVPIGLVSEPGRHPAGSHSVRRLYGLKEEARRHRPPLREGGGCVLVTHIVSLGVGCGFGLPLC